MASSSAVKLGRNENQLNLGFGFDDVDFSDRILRLEITPKTNPAGKRKREKPGAELDSGLKVKTLNICSLILAAKSPFFLRVFMDMLNSIYDRPLNATSRSELLDVLMVADKFEVTTCMKLCVELLLSLLNTIESSIFYLELPSSVFVGELTRPLIDSAKKYLADHFRHFDQSKEEEAMSLPLRAIEVVLGSDNLEVEFEDVVFDFILKWARSHYPSLKERRDILTNRMVRFICFGSISQLKLEEIVSDSFPPDLEYEQISKLVFNSVFSKDQLLDYPTRVYKCRLIDVTHVDVGEFFDPCCIVYFKMKKQEFAAMVLEERIYTEAFCLGGRRFFLFAERNPDHSVEHFGLFVEMMGSKSCRLNFETSVIKESSNKFQVHLTANLTLTRTSKAMGYRLCLWTDLMRDGSVYFIDGILHLKVQLTIL